MSTALPKSDRPTITATITAPEGTHAGWMRMQVQELLHLSLPAGWEALIVSGADPGARAAQQVAEEQVLLLKERRERIATQILAGALANPAPMARYDVFEFALSAADRLIAELDRSAGAKP